MKLELSIILKKATDIIDKQGLDQLSIGLLAEKLDVRPPSLYNHLDGLHELSRS